MKQGGHPPPSLVILGTCGGAREASQIVREYKAQTRIVFVNDVDAIDEVVIGEERFPVVRDWNFEPYRSAPDDFRLFSVGMGDPAAKRIVVEKALAQGLRPAPFLASHDVCIRPGAAIGDGSVVHPQSFVGTGTTIGSYAVIHKAAVACDVTMGAYVTCSPNSTTGEGACIGDEVHVGGRAVVVPGVRIAPGVRIGLSAGVFHDIDEPGSVQVGIPARRVA